MVLTQYRRSTIQGLSLTATPDDPDSSTFIPVLSRTSILSFDYDSRDEQIYWLEGTQQAASYSGRRSRWRPRNRSPTTNTVGSNFDILLLYSQVTIMFDNVYNKFNNRN